VEDGCDGDIDGSFMTLVTQRRGQRVSSARAHLGVAAGRPNLQVLSEALVDRVLFEGTRAIGVEFRQSGETTRIRARREVIVSAGTLLSPAVLMRSGIGPAGHLKAMGIEVLVDAPEVCQNLQEHASFSSSRFVNVPTFNTMTGPLRMARHLAEYALFDRGMLTSPPVQAMAHVRSDPELAQPNVKLSMGPVCFDVETRKLHKRAGVTVFINVSPPKSRGEIRLRSSNPDDRPVIDHRLYGDPADMRAMISGAKAVDRIFASPAFAKYVVGHNQPAEPPKDDAEWESQIRRFSNIGFHAVATCRMGADTRSVVDPELRVRGVDRLRVIDASIMPDMPTTNTNAPAMMIAEKGADLVRLAAG
jgi:choline dehydrogenase